MPRPRAFVTYDVRGCVLLAGPATPVLEMAAKLRGRFDVVAAVNGPRPEVRLFGVSIVSAEWVSLTGYLGRFAAEGRDRDGLPVDLAAKSTNDDGCYDLVVDLSREPILERPIPPLGYLRPGDPEQYEAALGALSALSGEIRKPRYFTFAPERCIHRRREVAGCDRCLAVCPAEAISSDRQTVRVDPHLCRGCGTCTTVCPTGALTYADPTPNNLVERLERMLQAFRAAGGTGPWIGFFAEDPAPLERWAVAQGVTVLPFAVRAVSSLGLETCLAAIGVGAAGVVMLVPGSVPELAAGALRQQVELAGKILAQLGHPPERVRILAGDAPEGPMDAYAARGVPGSNESWSYPMTDPDPRARLTALFERLSSRSQDTSGEAAVELPTWATFGGVALDKQGCTMCLACAGLCPTGALRAVHDDTELAFVEAACVQCGLCERGCPENAIERRPRFDYTALRGREMVVLNCVERANCAQCGRPFMSTALLASVSHHLTGEGAAVQQAREVLQICPQCRADNALRAQFAAISRAPK
jgi:ferredoxin